MNQIELEKLPGFITDRYNLNKVRYTDNTLLMANTEGKSRRLLGKVVA